MRPPDECPNCGAEVPPNARACPECGSDWETGWSDDATAQNLGIPDEKFDYDAFVERELSGKEEPENRLKPVWWIVALLLLLAFILYFVFQ